MSKRLLALAIVTFAGIFAAGQKAQATVNVTFQVNMGVYMQLGLFHPATDSIVIRGDFQLMAGDTVNWGGNRFVMTPSASNDSIYVLTVPLPDSAIGKTIYYKFVLHNTSGDGWENDPNRSYEITSDANQMIPLDFFNRRATAGVTHKITFQADLSALISQGFTDANDSIFVRGDQPPLNWGPGIRMKKSLLNPKLYSLQLSFTLDVGDSIQYKFWAGGSDNFSNSGWESGDNNIYHFVDKDTVLPAVQPRISIVNSTTTADTVTFHVNMNGARERFHNTLITGLKSVWIAGGVPPLTWPSNWLFSDTASGGALIRMYDDGSHGDSTAGDNVWSTVLVFPANSAQYVEFKYGAVFSGVDTLNGGASYLDNEAGFAQNHVLLLTGTRQFQYNKFGDQVTGIRENPNAPSKIPSTYELSQNYPNPFNPTTQIEYSIPKSGFVTLKVYNVLGQQVATLFAGDQKAGNYVATFDGSRLASGIYFYRLDAGSFSRTMKMVLMK
jgi:hypothetical protein